MYAVFAGRLCMHRFQFWQMVVRTWKNPLPAPATLNNKRNTRKGIENHEQITPTGAAIVLHWERKAISPI